jgi:hypothetical protein
MKKSIYILLIFIMLSGCGYDSERIRSDFNMYQEVYNGMTTESVKNLMGNPDNKIIIGSNSVWQYCTSDSSMTSYVDIMMKNRIVTGLRTHTGTRGGGCLQYIHYRLIGSTDAVIELRQR